MKSTLENKKIMFLRCMETRLVIVKLLHFKWPVSGRIERQGVSEGRLRGSDNQYHLLDACPTRAFTGRPRKRLPFLLTKTRVSAHCSVVRPVAELAGRPRVHQIACRLDRQRRLLKPIILYGSRHRLRHRHRLGCHSPISLCITQARNTIHACFSLAISFSLLSNLI